MSTIQKVVQETLQRVAPRGCEMRRFAESLLIGRETHWPSYGLRGRAKSWAQRYDASAQNVIAKLRAEGYVLKYQRGPRGGHYSATYRVTNGWTSAEGRAS